MSYILEALKKSNRERNRGQAPDLHVVHSSPPSFAQARSPIVKGWLYVVVAGLLAACLFAVYYKWYSPVPSGTVTGTGTGTQNVLEESGGPIDGSKTKSTVDLSPLKIETSISNESLGQGTGKATKREGEESGKQFLSLIARDKEKVHFAPEPEVPVVKKSESIHNDDLSDVETVVASVTDSESLPLKRDLPSEILRQLPDFKFAGHTFSDRPAERMIIINNQILREGGRIDQGTLLTEITWEGVVVDYKGTRFRIITH